jgi:hypothetical protein
VTYQEYLLSDTWKALRDRALVRAAHRCQLCNSDKRLEVHHRCYTQPLGTEPIDDLTVLCRRCHLVVTFQIQGRKITSDDTQRMREEKDQPELKAWRKKVIAEEDAKKKARRDVNADILQYKKNVNKFKESLYYKQKHGLDTAHTKKLLKRWERRLDLLVKSSAA